MPAPISYYLSPQTYNDKKDVLGVVAAIPCLTPLKANEGNQLWSFMAGLKGHLLVNRGTGTYLSLENGKQHISNANTFEWSVSSQDKASLKSGELLALLPGEITLGISSDDAAATKWLIAQADPSNLTKGSEDYVNAPEHLCITNHVSAAIKALNEIIHILEVPDRTGSSDLIRLKYTDSHYKTYKVRSSEVSQHFEFANEVLTAWTRQIGVNTAAEVKAIGELDNTISKLQAQAAIASSKVTELGLQHAILATGKEKTRTDYETAQKEHDDADAAYEHAKEEAELAKGSYEDASSSYDGYEGLDYGLITGNVWMAKDAERKAKKAVSKAKRTAYETSLSTYETVKKQWDDQTAELAKYNKAISDNKEEQARKKDKKDELEKHGKTLTALQAKITKCEASITSALGPSVSEAASLTLVRANLKTVTDELKKADDFKEQYKLLDTAALDHLEKPLQVLSASA